MKATFRERPYIPNPPGYPESDGKPIAENTLQFQWIVTIQGGLDACYRDNPEVFVAGDNLWYPVEGDPKIRMAPDIYVVSGRPKGVRGSYLQWLEDNIPLHVVFEVASPGNRPGELRKKFLFYERYGVEEYYFYDPFRNILKGWLRSDDKLQVIKDMDGWVSPRTKVLFQWNGKDLAPVGPDGKVFATYLELAAVREQAVQEKEVALLEKEEAVQQKTEAQRRAERLAAQLKALGIEPGV